MCVRVAAMSTVEHERNKQHTFNTKVNFSLLLPFRGIKLLPPSTFLLPCPNFSLAA
jgi:hypothetical protein